MRIYVYPADLTGCGYYRLIWPAKSLIAAGHDVRLLHPEDTNRIGGGVDDAGRLVSISLPNDADAVVFQRVSSHRIVEAIDIIRKNGIAVIIDIDDDMSAIHPSNPAWQMLHPRGESEYSWEATLLACERATYVTVSSHALLRRYVKHGRGCVLYNYVPHVFAQIERVEEPNTIGWGGSLHSHPDDPQVVGNAMNRLVRNGYTFKIVGPSGGTRAAFTLDDDPPATGSVPIQNYPHELKKLAVGIAPLNDTRFNAAKSWLKMLEYAALGVPCVVSPRAEYRRLHDLGVGVLANNPREWYRHSVALLSDDVRRAEMSQAGRVAAGELVIEKNAWRWAEAWNEAIGIERGPLGLRRSVVALPDRS